MVGAGYVGLVTAVGLAELGHCIHLVEIREDRLEPLRRGVPPIHEAGLADALAAALESGRLSVSAEPRSDVDVALVCVGTPIGPDGQSDLSQLHGALSTLDPVLVAGTPLIIRSTLPPGSTRMAVEWSGVPTSRVFYQSGVSPAGHRTRRLPLADPYRDRPLPRRRQGLSSHMWRPLYAEIDAPRMVVDVAAAELIKNGANAFLALKLSFTNEIACLAEEYSADVDEVLAGMALDPRIGVPVHAAVVRVRWRAACQRSCRRSRPPETPAACDMHVTIAAADANASPAGAIREPNRGVLGGLRGPNGGLLGLAFKAGTDDVRELALAGRRPPAARRRCRRPGS